MVNSDFSPSKVRVSILGHFRVVFVVIMQFEIILQYTPVARKRPSQLRQIFRQNTWKFQKLIVSLQRERKIDIR